MDKPQTTTLFLDHQQRLNLIALVGMQKGTVAEIRKFWSLQDKLELDADEKERIGYTTVMQNGMEAVRWNTNKNIPVRQFDMSEAECQRIRMIIDAYPDFQVSDRKWISSLLDQLPVETPIAAAPASVRE